MAQGTLNSENYDTADSGSDAVVTLAAVADRKHSLRGVSWSYAGDPTDGMLIIEDGATTVFEMPVTSGGPGQFLFPWSEKGSDNTALIVTLADGGVSKSLYVHIAP